MMTPSALKNFPPFVIGLALALTATFTAGVAWADPPTRIARLSYFTGTVSFSPAGDDEWAHAVLNRPVITGDRLWSDNGARVELAFDNGALWLGAATSVVVSNIDDRTAQFELQQGTLDLRVRRMSGGNIVEVDTPNLAFQVTRPGRYRIVVDPQSTTTTVVVRNGTAEVYGDGASYVVPSGRGYRFYGTDLRDSEYFTPRGVDEFERFVLERDSRFDRVVSARYVSSEVVGYEDLDRYGSWRPVESYGNVWFPQEVPSDWAPYRHGHWSWIDPWGWTWVDDAPWGFAPFHYGRWAYVQSRWGWVPGPVDVRPVYAPALVAFVGGSNFSVSVSSGPAIGWFPLAPREVYRPAYNVSREYYRQVNVSNTVINNTVINNTYVSNVTNTTAPVTQQVNYVNLRAPNAVTAVPPAAFAQSQPINRVAVPLPSAAFNNAQIQSMAQIAPARTAFVGAAPPAQAKPPAAVQQQPVVAKSPPPPAPVPVAQRLPALEKNPGKPLDRADIQATRTAGPASAPAQNVKVVDPGKPTTAAPPPAVQGDASRARTAPPSAATPSVAPPAPQAGTAATPAPRPETRGQPPAAPTPPTPTLSERPDRRIDNRGGDPAQPPRPLEAPRQAGPPPGAPAPTVPQPPPRPADPQPASVAPPGAPQPPAMTRPPEPRAVPQDQPRPAPQAQPPAPRPPEPPRAVPQEQPRPVPQPLAPRPPEPSAAPQDQPRPAPQAQPPAPRLPEPRAVPPEQRPAAEAQPVPESRPAAPPLPARPPEPRGAQPQPQAQPVPAAPPKPEVKPDNKRDDKKDKEKEKDKEKDKQQG